LSAPAVERLTDFDCAVGESPVWRASENALYWVDIPKGLIHRLSMQGGAAECWRAEEMVACIAFDRRGGLVAGMQTGIFRLELAPGGAVFATRLAAPEFEMPDMRFNDGRCDRQGRFWAGTMHLDIPAGHAVGRLYRYDSAVGLTKPVVDGLYTQNGLGFSPDGTRMYLSDSHPKARVIWCFDYDIDEGLPRNRRVFVDMREHPGRPDGAAVDADGCYWTCAADGARVMRFTPQGKLDRHVEVPVPKPTMCAFGGPAFDTMYITSIAGPVFALRPGVRGLPEPEFGAAR
jgi:sugar lactone lactonase YvrE